MEHVDATISPFIFTAKFKGDCCIREKKKERGKLSQGDRREESVASDRKLRRMLYYHSHIHLRYTQGGGEGTSKLQVLWGRKKRRK